MAQSRLFYEKLSDALNKYSEANGGLSKREMSFRIGGVTQPTIADLMNHSPKGYSIKTITRVESFLRKVGMHPEDNVTDRPFITAENFEDLDKMHLVPISQQDREIDTEEKLIVLGLILGCPRLTSGKKMRILHTLYPDTSIIIKKGELNETSYP